MSQPGSDEAELIQAAYRKLAMDIIDIRKDLREIMKRLNKLLPLDETETDEDV